MEFGVSLEFERRLHPVGVCDCIMSSLSVHFFSLLLEGASNSGPAALPFVFLIVWLHIVVLFPWHHCTPCATFSRAFRYFVGLLTSLCITAYNTGMVRCWGESDASTLPRIATTVIRAGKKKSHCSTLLPSRTFGTMGTSNSSQGPATDVQRRCVHEALHRGYAVEKQVLRWTQRRTGARPSQTIRATATCCAEYISIVAVIAVVCPPPKKKNSLTKRQSPAISAWKE